MLRSSAVLALVAALVGLPINDLFGYFVLVVAATLAFCGEITSRRGPWIAAVSLVAITIAGQWLLSPPAIEEGHNVFLGDDPNGVMRNGLPADVFQFLSQEFEANYSIERRCDPHMPGCWRGDGAVLRSIYIPPVPSLLPSFRQCKLQTIDCLHGYNFPDRVFAFSADGIFQKPIFSRRVFSINFSDPAWLHFGFTNDGAYNWWPTVSDIQRVTRSRNFLIFGDRSILKMPWFVMYRFPAAHVGSSLCWKGTVLWERAEQRFDVIAHTTPQCRTLNAEDVNRRIFGGAVTPNTLAMHLEPNRSVWMSRIARDVITAIAALGVLLLLVQHYGRAALPLTLIAAALLIVSLIDATMIGGLRTHIGREDALFHDSAARYILQSALAGDIKEALKGGEAVYYYSGPGFRYLRALEKFIFGDTTLGYLTLILVFPIIVLALCRRFLSQAWALAVTAVFVLTPVGAFFGSSFFLYAKYAIQGFADPAAYILFLCALLHLMDREPSEMKDRFWYSFSVGLLFAIVIITRPVLAPATGVLLASTAILALGMRHWRYVAGLCFGFSPVFALPLHNWYFGGVLVLTSANATDSDLLVMRPADYAAALHELATFNFAGGRMLRALHQIADWLSGFIGQVALTGHTVQLISVPFHAAAVAILIYIAGWGRRLDHWLRIVAGATLAQHCVALFYVGSGRYFMLTWFLTMLVVAAWLETVGLSWLRERYPSVFARIPFGNGNAKARNIVGV